MEMFNVPTEVLRVHEPAQVIHLCGTAHTHDLQKPWGNLNKSVGYPEINIFYHEFVKCYCWGRFGKMHKVSLLFLITACKSQ